MTSQETVTITVVRGVEGPSLYLNDFRVAGPKPWGGGSTICEFKAERADIEEALQRNALQQNGAPK